MRAAATMVSAVSCGAAPWPPRPSTSIANSSTAAISAPRLTPILPTGSWFQRWRPNAAVDAFEDAVVRAGLRPAAAFLGGLEEEAQAGAGSARRRGARATARPDRHVAVVAAGVHAARSLRRVGRLVRLGEREGVHVRAQQEPPARRAQVRDDARPADARRAARGRAREAARRRCPPSGAPRRRAPGGGAGRAGSRRVPRAPAGGNSASSFSAERGPDVTGRDYMKRFDEGMTPRFAGARPVHPGPASGRATPSWPRWRRTRRSTTSRSSARPSGRFSRSSPGRSAPAASSRWAAPSATRPPSSRGPSGRGGQVFYTDGSPDNAERASGYLERMDLPDRVEIKVGRRGRARSRRRPATST